uniref:Uncharacterized protein n=1 Tax=Plectus sambesii TaxID=2011161 RepID=A0A914V358_9BILA
MDASEAVQAYSLKGRENKGVVKSEEVICAVAEKMRVSK